MIKVKIKDKSIDFIENNDINSNKENINEKELISQCWRCKKSIYKEESFIKQVDKFTLFSKLDPFHNKFFCKECVKEKDEWNHEGKISSILYFLDIITFFLLIFFILFIVFEVDDNLENQKDCLSNLFLFLLIFFIFSFLVIIDDNKYKLVKEDKKN